MILIAFHKPVGIVCTAEKREKNNVIDYINYPKRIYPVGRLDKDSEGLILMTNNGEMMDKILRSANGHEKEYIVTVNKEIDDSFIKAMSGGIYLAELDRTTKPCKVTALGRIRIMNILLGDLKPGEYRNVTEAEYQQLKEQLYDSAK